MNNKPDDVLYCGVREDVIKRAVPTMNIENFNMFTTWIRERYMVHVRKDVDLEKGPWTDDPVIQKYRFTNVRREHDRVTKWYIHNIAYNPSLSLHEKVVNTFLFRAWNKYETMEILGGPFNEDALFDKEGARKAYLEHRKKDHKYVWFTPAFNTGGLKRAYKYPSEYSYNMTEKQAEEGSPDYEEDIPIRMFHIPPYMEKKDTYRKIMDSHDQGQCFDAIQEVHGFGPFLSYQVFVDLTYIPEFKFSENEFTVAGPGCQRGINLIFVDRAGMTYEESIFWIRDFLQKSGKKYFFRPKVFMTDLPKQDRVMNVMSLENCFCEISKYIKAVEEKGRPRMTYKPHVEMSAQKRLF